MEPWKILISKDKEDNATVEITGLVPEALEYVPDLIRKVASLIECGDCVIKFPEGIPTSNPIKKFTSIRGLKNYIREKAVEEKKRNG